MFLFHWIKQWLFPLPPKQFPTQPLPFLFSFLSVNFKTTQREPATSPRQTRPELFSSGRSADVLRWLLKAAALTGKGLISFRINTWKHTSGQIIQNSFSQIDFFLSLPPKCLAEKQLMYRLWTSFQRSSSVFSKRGLMCPIATKNARDLHNDSHWHHATNYKAVSHNHTFIILQAK